MTELMNQKQVRNLLLSPEPEFKDLGIQQLLIGLPDTCQLALEYLAQCEAKHLDALTENLRRHLPFLRNCFGPPRNAGKRSYEYFTRTHTEMEAFLEALRAVMIDIEAPDRKNFLKRMAGFTGIEEEIHDLTGELWSHELSEYFNLNANRTKNDKMARQFMIFLSYTCNLSCPYCFAKGRKEPDLPLNRVIKIIEWAQENGAKKITFCGGEPTIYSEFPTILDEIQDRELKTYFATNLLGRLEVLDKLNPEVVESLIVHVAPMDAYKEKQWNSFSDNVRKVRDKGVHQAMRINMFKKNCDFTHVFHLAEKYGLNEIQFALTFPALNEDNRFIPLREFRSMIPEVMELMRACEDTDLRFVLSKPIPLCLFAEDDRDHLIHRIEFSPACSAFADGCTHNACISPTENVSPCLGLLDITRPFSEFNYWNDLSSFCSQEILPLLDRPLFDHCPDCFLFERRLCQGACLSHKNIEKVS